MIFKKTFFFISLFGCSISVCSELEFNRNLAISSIEALLEKPCNTDQDNLIHAIINRDIENVTKYAKKLDLNDTPFQSFIDGDKLTKCKASSNLDKEVNSLRGFYIGHTYLSLAILNTLRDNTDIEKNNSISIIQELLKNKANIHYPKFSKDFTYGLGFAYIVNKNSDSHQKAGTPHEFFCPLIFYPVIFQCSLEILELLFKFGASADSKLDGFNGRDTLLEFAMKTKAINLIPLIEKTLHGYDDFRKSEKFNYLSCSMQNLYNTIDTKERSLFMEVSQDLSIIFSEMFNELKMSDTKLFIYIDLNKIDQLKNNKKINKSQRDSLKIKQLKQKISQLALVKIQKIKEVLQNNLQVKNKLIECCKTENNQLFLVFSCNQPDQQYEASINPILDAIQINLE